MVLVKRLLAPRTDALAAGSKWQGGRSAAGRHPLHNGQAVQRVVGRPLRVFSRGSGGALAALVLAAQPVVGDALVEGRPTWQPVPTQETSTARGLAPA